MQLADILNQAGGLESVAREFGISSSDATAAAEVLLPAILGGLKKQTQPAGLEGLLGVLGGLGGSGLLDEVLSPGPTDVRRGNEVLGQIFGSPDVSRTVAQHASTRSGLDPALLKRMLPVLAMLAAGYLSRHGAARPGTAMNGAAPYGQPAEGGLASLLDLDGDGNPLDDILAIAGKVLA
jgi:hypothetical protein